jgi:hypothetical protein
MRMASQGGGRDFKVELANLAKFASSTLRSRPPPWNAIRTVFRGHRGSNRLRPNFEVLPDPLVEEVA